MSDSKLLIIVGLVTAVIIGIGLYFFSRQPEVTTSALIPTSGVVHAKGPADAPVTIVEFADFQCPACGAFHPVLSQLLSDYEGSVRYVHRQFPLPIHEYALQAAEASESADAQGKFWEMYELLYENQDDLSKEAILKYAKSLDLDTQQMSKDLDDHTYLTVVNRDLADGKSVGVTGTPTLFINGQQYRGSRDYDTLGGYLESLGATKNESAQSS